MQFEGTWSMLFNVYEWHFGCLVALHSRHSAAPYQEMSKAFLQIVERNRYPSGEKKAIELP